MLYWYIFEILQIGKFVKDEMCMVDISWASKMAETSHGTASIIGEHICVADSTVGDAVDSHSL